MDEFDIYLNLFYEEMDKYLRVLNENVLLLEEQPDDIKVINEIFRSAHTMKGMAATMGLKTIADLTHEMETVFQLLKDGEIEVTYNLITSLFTCLDTLASIVEDLQSGGAGEMDIERIVTDLKAIANESSEKDSKKSTSISKNTLTPKLFTWDTSDLLVIEESKKQGYKAYVVAIRLKEETAMKGARAFLLMNALEAAGELILTEPSAQELETGEFEGDINILYLTKLSFEEVENLVSAESDIEAVAVKAATEVLIEETKILTAENTENETKKGTKPTVPINRPQKRQTIRVDLERINHFMNLVSELVIHRSRLEELTMDIGKPGVTESLEQVERITTELQEVVLQMRMQPFSIAVQRFPRMIRDLADELDKELNLVIQGEDTELDRTVVTELSEPLVHLLRNAADHGIETPAVREKTGKEPQGTITVGAFSQGNRVVVTVSDDGQGMDPEAIKASAERKGISTAGFSDDEIIDLVFHPGFSTKKQVTGVSGRGVGMDVVKEKILSLNGSIDITSEVGKGTTFRITLPLTLSIIQSLLVKASTQTLALPQTVIEKIELYEETAIKTVHQSQMYLYEREYIPVVYLSERLGLERQLATNPYIVIVTERDQHVALVVDDLVDQREIVIKDLGAELGEMEEYLGATILGNGEVVLVIDLSTICRLESDKVSARIGRKNTKTGES